MNEVTHDETRTKQRGPERTCVGCRAHDAQTELMRFAFDGERLVPDVRARLGGRGVWVHATRRCITAAIKGGGFSKVLRAKVPFDVDSVVRTLETDYEARVLATIGNARRARHAVHGTDVCRAAISDGSARLVVVARDARASRDAVAEAARAANVPVVELGEKSSLGRVFGKEETGVAVVMDPGLANSISQAAKRLAALSEAE